MVESEQINEVEDKVVEITSKEQNKVKTIKRGEDSLRDLWEHIKDKIRTRTPFEVGHLKNMSTLSCPGPFRFFFFFLIN